jgi:hypothetical protein
LNLPLAEQAVIDPAKVRDYLLAAEHPVGRSKAKFFTALGFEQERWQELSNQLMALAQSGEAEVGRATKFGQKYIVRGMIQVPSGGAANIKSVWIVPSVGSAPQFVTAIPEARK